MKEVNFNLVFLSTHPAPSTYVSTSTRYLGPSGRRTCASWEGAELLYTFVHSKCYSNGYVFTPPLRKQNYND